MAAPRAAFCVYGGAMRAVLPLALLLVLAGCAGRFDPDRPGVVRYRCTAGAEVVARYEGRGAVALALPGGTVLELDRVRAASGSRYGGEHAAWHVKGSEALLLDAGRAVGCRALAKR